MIYASPGRRFVGYFIDLFILGLVIVVLVPFMGISLEDIREWTPPPQLAVVALVISGIYQIGFITWRGQTPGKMALRIKVVDEDSGALPAVTAAAARWVVPAAAQYLPGMLGLGVVAVIYGWLLWDPRRQGVHDKVGRTVVIDMLLPLAPPPDPTGRHDDEELPPLAPPPDPTRRHDDEEPPSPLR